MTDEKLRGWTRQEVEDRDAREVWRALPEDKRQVILELLSEMENQELVEHIKKRVLDS
mgnify:CR=1 FL=1|jgi:Mg/Co/Ni transporter MgtE|tara:strand:- start:317 stop:490 length:174 start_codon:yes stop_codon:yes gene_type:complete